MRASRPIRINVADLLKERRVVMTDGLSSGSVTYAAVTDAIEPPSDRTLMSWADEVAKPWVEVVDNEIAYWGGLTDLQIDTLLAWFVTQRPLAGGWRDVTFAPGVAARLRQVLFAHGWIRNVGLVRDGRKPSVELWAGVVNSCLLEHQGSLIPSVVGQGIRLSGAASGWTLVDVGSRCPLDDDAGKSGLSGL